MAPLQTLSWVIPSQTIVFVATQLMNNSTSRSEPEAQRTCGNHSDIQTFAFLCIMALGFGYWIGLTKRHEDEKATEEQKNQRSEEADVSANKDLENGEASKEISSVPEST